MKPAPPVTTASGTSGERRRDVQRVADAVRNPLVPEAAETPDREEPLGEERAVLGEALPLDLALDRVVAAPVAGELHPDQGVGGYVPRDLLELRDPRVR